MSNEVDFVIDDILESKFSDYSLDFILDRGCFHTLEQAQRAKNI